MLNITTTRDQKRTKPEQTLRRWQLVYNLLDTLLKKRFSKEFSQKNLRFPP